MASAEHAMKSNVNPTFNTTKPPPQCSTLDQNGIANQILSTSTCSELLFSCNALTDAAQLSPAPSTNPTPSRRSSSASSTTNSSNDLPFPTPLPRNAFLDPNFSSASFLSTLSHRHQTLSDLRSDLSERSAAISNELLNLVNNEYQAFLSLGSDLRGGDEKVQEVRVGVLGFAKGVGGIKERVAERRAEVAKLLQERERLRREIVFGQEIVAVAESLEGLEDALAVTGAEEGSEGEAWSDEDEDEDEDDADEATQDWISVGRLGRVVEQFVSIRNQVSRLGGSELPFLAKQEEKLAQLKKTLLLDLNAALKQAKQAGSPGNSRVVRLMPLYSDLEEPQEALKVLKEASKR
jgi:hypothetical protein